MEARIILVVDDDKTGRELLIDLFKNFSESWSFVAKVFEAANGKEAQQMIVDYELEGRQPDLVVSDIEMGHPNGIELCRVVKMSYPKIKVILVSGRDEYQPVAEAAGCDLFMEKPLDFLRLEEAVSRLLIS